MTGVTEPQRHPLLGEPEVAASSVQLEEVKIGPHRNIEIVLPGPLAEIRPLLGALLGQGDLHGIPPTALKATSSRLIHLAVRL
jgi:hypothetical protein